MSPGCSILGAKVVPNADLGLGLGQDLADFPLCWLRVRATGGTRRTNNVGLMSNFVVTDYGIVLNRTAAADGRVPLAAWDLGSASDTGFLSTEPLVHTQGAPSPQVLQGVSRLLKLLFDTADTELRHLMSFGGR